MNSSIVSTFQAEHMLNAIILRRMWCTSMPIRQSNDTTTDDTEIYAQSFASEDLITEYRRRYKHTSMFELSSWNAEGIAFIDHYIQSKNEPSFEEVLQICELLLDGASLSSLKQRIFFADSCVPSAILMASHFLQEQRA